MLAAIVHASDAEADSIGVPGDVRVLFLAVDRSILSGFLSCSLSFPGTWYL